MSFTNLLRKFSFTRIPSLEKNNVEETKQSQMLIKSKQPMNHSKDEASKLEEEKERKRLLLLQNLRRTGFAV